MLSSPPKSPSRKRLKTLKEGHLAVGNVVGCGVMVRAIRGVMKNPIDIVGWLIIAFGLIALALTAAVYGFVRGTSRKHSPCYPVFLAVISFLLVALGILEAVM